MPKLIRQIFRKHFLLMALCLSALSVQSIAKEEMPPVGFVYVKDRVTDIVEHMVYFGADNFVGQRIDGYEAARCILTTEAAEAIAVVQGRLETLGLGLILFDCYRPQRAVNHFMRWAADSGDLSTKTRYYPEIAKDRIIPEGYVAERSGHSRGSTVDLGIIESFTGELLDFGTQHDFFGPLANTDNPDIVRAARRNRDLLVSVMEAASFTNYPAEWWHFTLESEPYPDTYFDFPIRDPDH